MEKFRLGKMLTGLLAVMIFITGCMPSDVPKVQRDLSSVQTAAGVGSGSTSGATSGDTTTTTTTSLPPKVEIRHLIEPNLSTDPNYTTGTGYAGGGSYVRKLSLPKNFAGKLYVAGINIGTLSSRFVKVRFKFGQTRESVLLPATVTQAPGITPSTTISVLVLDLKAEPFRSIRLPYDLYDYNEYGPSDTPTQDNRDSGLYCRGLNVEDDPTFVGVGACDGLQSNPDQPEEECLYSYAKVLDQGLLKLSGGLQVPVTPTLPQLKSIIGNNYYQDYPAKQLLKVLPDTIPTSASNTMGNFKFSEVNGATGSTAVNFNYPTTSWDPVTIGTSQYYYRGPYRLVNSAGWQFQFAQLDGPKRLFKQNSWVDYPLYLTRPLPDDSASSPTMNKLYYNSLMFPLATKLSIGANVTHLSSNTVDGTRSENNLSSAGATLWMDGSNARVQTKNTDGEHVGSCNVTATMEVLAKDDNGVDYVIASTNEVKLQLVRPTQYRTDSGNEVLYSNFKSCSTNASCGGSECCFNNRCWDQSLVSQCFDPSAVQGNRTVGEACTSDLQCTSLCCNRTSGACAPHNTLLNPAVLCQKPIGEFCIAKEWCQKAAVVKCLVVKTGTDTQGNVTCRQQCYNTLEYGDCKNGACVAPVQAPIPVFNASDPNACANAVPAPDFSG